MKLQRLFIIISLVILLSIEGYSQKEIAAIFPVNGSVNVNTAILKWSAREGMKYDLYFGLSANPSLYKADLETMEEKPVVIQLNKKYYWKIVEKKDGKEVGSSKIFTFSTLPISLNPAVEYKSFVDLRDYKIYWTTTINNSEWFVQNLDYDLQNMSWYYDNSETNNVYGRLYSGESLTTNPSDVCPDGWHVPSQQELNDLLNAFDGIKFAGPSLKEATEVYWRASKNLRSNKSGFTILPAGSRDSKPSFSNIGKYTSIWTSTPNPKIQGSFYCFDLGFMRDNVIFSVGDPKWSYSIRCIKDK
jgi:uncharacterized protein (TIGR02145 family)